MPEQLRISIFVSMGIAQHIEALLYRYQCVVVPSFGAFLTQNKPAFLQKESNTFFPPSRELSFNAQLQSNDGLLVNHIAQIEKMPYEEALKRVEIIAEDWMQEVREKGQLRLEGLGEFRLNSEGKLRFRPFERTNFLTASFGFSPIMASPISREVLKQEVEELEERGPFAITPEKRGVFGLQPYAKYAAIVFLAIASGLSIYSWNTNHSKALSLAQNEAQKQVVEKIQSATFFAGNPLELPTLILEVSKPEPEKLAYHIIAGAFRIRENADRKIEQLKSKGFQAGYVGENRYGLHQVAYASFADEQKAVEVLMQIKRSGAGDAWLYSER